jgi:hypothetical protein
MNKAAGLLLVILLAACSRPPPATPPPLVLSPEQMLAKIRNQAEIETEVAFQAMPDEAVSDLRTQAQQAERAGDIAGAVAYLEAALQLQAADPETLQQRAELAIWQRRWPLAERMAQQSYAAGARLGSLCRRNWLTMHYASLAQGRQMPEPQLAKSLADCTVLPPARL